MIEAYAPLVDLGQPDSEALSPRSAFAGMCLLADSGSCDCDCDDGNIDNY